MLRDSRDEPLDSSEAGTGHPRVLIISPQALGLTGSSLTMSSLFEGWPRARLASIYSRPQIEPADEICANYYQLYPRISPDPREWPRRALDYLTDKSETLDGITSIRITSALKAFIAEFSPDLVYSQLGPLWMTRLTNRVVAELGVPLVVHVMDDYITDWPVVGRPGRNIFPIAQILNRLNRRAFAAALERASLLYVISPKMAEEYQGRYGYEFSVAYRGIDPERWPSASTLPSGDAEQMFRMFFGGSISANKNLSSLQDVAGAVVALNTTGIPIRLEIACYHVTPGLRAELERPPYVEFVPTVPSADMPARMAESDLLILPFDFSEGAIRYIRYSWPTKLAECMMSGVPMLMYGPIEAGFVKAASAGGWAHVVDRRDDALLSERLRELVLDSALRRGPVAQARTVARSDHDARAIRARFQRALHDAAR